jgi:ankyrin repeat protein
VPTPDATQATDLLVAAIRAGNDRDAELALKRGANPNAQDRDGRSCLHNATIGRDLTMVELLISSGADVNAADRAGWRPLHFAAQACSTELAELLIAHGAEVDAVDAYGNTPLWRAVFESRGRGEMISLLLAHGANREKANKTGKSPVALAKTIANYDVYRYLRSNQ